MDPCQRWQMLHFDWPVCVWGQSLAKGKLVAGISLFFLELGARFLFIYQHTLYHTTLWREHYHHYDINSAFSPLNCASCQSWIITNAKLLEVSHLTWHTVHSINHTACQCSSFKTPLLHLGVQRLVFRAQSRIWARHIQLGLDLENALSSVGVVGEQQLIFEDVWSKFCYCWGKSTHTTQKDFPADISQTSQK